MIMGNEGPSKQSVIDGAGIVASLTAGSGGTQIFREIAFQQFRRPYVVEYPPGAIVLFEPTHHPTSASSAADGNNNSKRHHQDAEERDLIYDDENDPRRPIPEALTMPSFFAQLHFRWTSIRPHGRGLVNLGNTCFLNAVVQALTYCPPLNEYLTVNIKTKLTPGPGVPLDFAFELSEVMRALHGNHNNNSHGQRAVRPNFLVSNLRALSKTYRPGSQACSHEFTQQLLDACQTAVLYRFQRGQQKVPHNVTFTSPLFCILGGHLRSQVAWSKADEIQMLRKANNVQAAQELVLDKSQGGSDQLVSNTFDPFTVLNVPLTGSSLGHCLDSFFGKEQLEGRIYLSPRKVGVRATKCLRLHRLPALLTLHIKRFNFRGQKMNKLVEFPLDLDVAPYCSKHATAAAAVTGSSETGRSGGATKTGEEQTAAYSLTAVVVHHGQTSFSGHYVCFAKGSNGTWHLFDDDRISQVTVDTVKKCQAYMLFYTKKNGEQLRPVSSRSRVATHQQPSNETTSTSANRNSLGGGNQVLGSPATRLGLTQLTTTSTSSIPMFPVASSTEEDLGKNLVDDRAIAAALKKRKLKMRHDAVVMNPHDMANNGTTLVEQAPQSATKAIATQQELPLGSPAAERPLPLFRKVPVKQRFPADDDDDEIIENDSSQPPATAHGTPRTSINIRALSSSPRLLPSLTSIETEFDLSAEHKGAATGAPDTPRLLQVAATGEAALTLMANHQRGEESFTSIRRPRHAGRQFQRRPRDEQYEQEMDRGRLKKVSRREGDEGNEEGWTKASTGVGRNPFQTVANLKARPI